MRKEFWSYSGRGRRSGNNKSYKDRQAIEYLAIMALKYKADSNEFFNCILKAWNHVKAQYRNLNIICRLKTKDSATFLFTAGQDVVSQFSISTSILQGKNPLEGYIQMISTGIPTRNVVNPKIKGLRAGMKRINLKAKVIEIPEPNKVFTRSGVEAYVSNVIIGDETGTIKVCLWNKQINTISKGDKIKIQNSTVTKFKGDLQLRIGRSGGLSVIK
jgi:replication factor A1